MKRCIIFNLFYQQFFIRRSITLSLSLPQRPPSPHQPPRLDGSMMLSMILNDKRIILYSFSWLSDSIVPSFIKLLWLKPSMHLFPFSLANATSQQIWDEITLFFFASYKCSGVYEIDEPIGEAKTKKNCWAKRKRIYFCCPSYSSKIKLLCPFNDLLFLLFLSINNTDQVPDQEKNV